MCCGFNDQKFRLIFRATVLQVAAKFIKTIQWSDFSDFGFEKEDMKAEFTILL